MRENYRQSGRHANDVFELRKAYNAGSGAARADVEVLSEDRYRKDRRIEQQDY